MIPCLARITRFSRLRHNNNNKSRLYIADFQSQISSINLVNTDAFAGFAAFVPITFRTNIFGITLHKSGAVAVIVPSRTQYQIKLPCSFCNKTCQDVNKILWICNKGTSQAMRRLGDTRGQSSLPCQFSLPRNFCNIP